MSYQVLARKWRPRSFPQMVGQNHVRQALINALEHQRLHHAYLFTGTRGVGKTTIARIFSKSLNCETNGISANPCGICATCTDIDAGRFVDLIEVDAASRTKVEDTREILDNVQYAPSRGRFKVYLIDEVHMLSTSSFNALLKTLEEPPSHVKFLLATTDPQKLPATILSRCLQFNLKRIPVEQIAAHLAYILQQEQLPFEESVLDLLALAADGSLRDALSLLDQAIAYGAGRLLLTEVQVMLGTLDQNLALELLQALAAQDAKLVLQHSAKLAEQNPDFNAILADMLSWLQKIAMLQVVGNIFTSQQAHLAEIKQLANNLSPEQVQLFYQIALLGRRDLYLAPQPRGGFEMVLLRMLAFTPLGEKQRLISPTVEQSVETPETVEKIEQIEQIEKIEADNGNEWHKFVTQLPKTLGVAKQLAENCILQRKENNIWHLSLDPAYKILLTPKRIEDLQTALQNMYSPAIKLNIYIERANAELNSPAQEQQQLQKEQNQALSQQVQQDPFIQELQQNCDAKIHKIHPKT
jgi:DNA polymerase III subunit gamma/tau